ncbi:hypothetical protein BDR07DRAFT_1377318 [Suillus spraguei]|nr:hypothetical protein BDR07DRAFT_1377318 [Suillus spraguei]
MMLNAMTDNFWHICNYIANALSATSSAGTGTTNTYGPSNICAHLDVEQQLLDTEKSKGGDITLVTHGRTGGNAHECGCQGHSFCCTNCNSWGHYVKDCFGKGGSMEGRHKEVLAWRHASETTSKGGATTKPTAKAVSTGKPGGVRYDTSGCA